MNLLTNWMNRNSKFIPGAYATQRACRKQEEHKTCVVEYQPKKHKSPPFQVVQNK